MSFLKKSLPFLLLAALSAGAWFGYPEAKKAWRKQARSSNSERKVASLSPLPAESAFDESARYLRVRSDLGRHLASLKGEFAKKDVRKGLRALQRSLGRYCPEGASCELARSYLADAAQSLKGRGPLTPEAQQGLRSRLAAALASLDAQRPGDPLIARSETAENWLGTGGKFHMAAGPATREECRRLGDLVFARMEVKEILFVDPTDKEQKLCIYRHQSGKTPTTVRFGKDELNASRK